MTRAKHDATSELPDPFGAPPPELLDQLPPVGYQLTAQQRQMILDAKRRHVEKHLGRPLRRGEEDQLRIRARDGAVVTSSIWRATTRTPRGPAPGRRQGSRRTTARVAANGDRDGPEPGDATGDLVAVLIADLAAQSITLERRLSALEDVVLLDTIWAETAS